jgi:hypothetical protein
VRFIRAIAEGDKLLDKGRLPKAEHDRLELLSLLSLGQIRKLRDTLGISPDLLIGK